MASGHHGTVLQAFLRPVRLEDASAADIALYRRLSLLFGSPWFFVTLAVL
jgi:hypothetical protein